MNELPQGSKSAGTFAFLFSDIEGSTIRWERQPEAMRVALARHDGLIRVAVEAHGGHVFKTVGDAFCVAFRDAADAVSAAVAVQRVLAAEDFSAVDGVRVRMGVHAGSAEFRDNDYFGQTLNRVAQLMAAAHGGQILVSGAVAALLQGVPPDGCHFKDLGQRRLKDLTQPEHVFQVEAPDLVSNFPELRSQILVPNNLPQQATTFIGRRRELEEVEALFGRYRLITLAGSGGLGKTRLSLQIATDVMAEFPDGVWFVELAPLGAPELVAETLAALFGLGVPVGTDAVTSLITFLRHKKLLLIFDNCEHLVAEVARVVGAIIRSAAQVHILTSSRERLGLGGEFVFQVPALSMPSPGRKLTAAEAVSHTAVKLFVERAALVLGGFELTDEIAPDVVEICRRLDGIALAIELAVPRLKMLKPKELLSRLNDRFRILKGGDRATLPRQQTLRALIDWSYNLLSEPERLVLNRLSVFADAIELEDAALVVCDAQLETWEVFDLVAALLEKSLIVRIGDETTESRYRMLESTRAYGVEKLKESGEEPIFRQRLLGHLIERFQQADREYQTAATEPWLAKYGRDLENLRSALDWAFAAGGDPKGGIELVGLTLFLFEELSLPRERARWCDLATAALDPSTSPAISGRILLAGVSTGWFGQRRDAETLWCAIAFFREADEPIWLGCALSWLGGACAGPGDVAEAEEYYREAEAILRPYGETRGLTRLLTFMGAAREFDNDPTRAKQLYDEAIAMAEALSDRRALLSTKLNLAEFEFASGRVAETLNLAHEAMAEARRANALVPLAMLCANLTGYLIAGGDLAGARVSGSEGLELNLSLGQDYFAVICLEHLALWYGLSGDIQRAASLLGYTSAYYLREGRRRESTELASWHRLTAILNTALPAAETDQYKAIGAAWELTEAAAEATA